jgi:hypothetical protein
MKRLDPVMIKFDDVKSLVKCYRQLAKAGKANSDMVSVLLRKCSNPESLLLQFAADEEPALVVKALPKSDGEKPVKKAPQNKASKKQAGAGGKTRYSYPGEKGGDKKAGASSTPGFQPKSGKLKPAVQDPVQAPQEPTPKLADPAELANQLQVSVAMLQKIAKRFKDNEKLGGRDGFIKFMGTRLKEVVEKHKLDDDYFGLVFDALVGGTATQKQ